MRTDLWTPGLCCNKIICHQERKITTMEKEKKWTKKIILKALHKSWNSKNKKIKGRRKDSCTEEEKQLLYNIFEHNPKKYIIEKFAEFNRSPASIFRFAKQLGLKRDPELIKQDMVEGGRNAPAREDFWTSEEDNLLKKIYENNSKEFLLSKFNKTWRAIREHARILGLLRNRTFVNKDIVDHNKITTKERYGVEYSTQLPSMQEKSRQTNLKKRGVEYPTQSAEVREKMKKTIQEKYGVDNVFQSEDIQQKAHNSFYKNSSQKCSKQQTYIANLIQGKINFPIGTLNVDILLENKIVCEYNGGGHFLQVKLKCISQKEFDNQERKRDIFLKTKGYSIIKIISRNDLLPNDSTLLKMIEEGKNYLKTGHSWIEFDIDKKQIRCKVFCLVYNFGHLRKILKSSIPTI